MITLQDQVNQAKIVNACMGQRDKIVFLMDAVDADYVRFHLAYDAIQLCFPVWDALGYGYKAKELYARLKDNIERVIRSEEDYISNIRKNDRTRSAAIAEIKRLRELHAKVKQ